MKDSEMIITPVGFLVGLDLGQAQDYTAVAVLQQFERASWVTPAGEQLGQADFEARRSSHELDPEECSRESLKGYDLVHLARLQLGTPYPAVVGHVKQLLREPRLQHWPTPSSRSRSGPQPPVLVLDATGVGAAVRDDFRRERLEPIAITITAGDTAHWVAGGWRVPKRDLVGLLSVLLETDRLRIARGMRHADTLRAELENFRVKLTPLTGTDTYGVWREGQHDDLVLAVAIAAWWGERRSLNQAEEYVFVPPASR